MFSIQSLFILITASSKSGLLVAADYLGKKTNFHKGESYESSPPVPCFHNSTYLPAKYAEMLKGKNN